MAKFERVLIAPLVCFGLCLTLGLIWEGDAASTGSNEVSQLKKILETETTQYLFSQEATNPITAQKICEQHSAQLLSIENEEEFKALARKLQGLAPSLGDSVWTSGKSFSNSTYGNLLSWSSTNELFTYSEFYEQQGDNSATGSLKSYPMLVKNRRKRGISKDDCDCNCGSTTPLPPFTPQPCRKPICEVNLPKDPICENISPPRCSIGELPNCDLGERKCTVHCPDCVITRQPNCTIDPNYDPNTRCTLVMPKCEKQDPICRVIGEGTCRAVQDNCTKDDSDACKPIIKPCKNTCTEPECASFKPPCQTTEGPCHTVIVCPPGTIPSSPCKMRRHCRDTGSGKREDCVMIHDCPDSWTPHPTGCTPIKECPPSRVTCPPPVSACTRPFVDCSPEICQSSVHLCLPPKIRCPPARIICEPPEVRCDVHCPGEPEVVCGEPTIICDKPKVVCPPITVHCDTQVSTCEPAKLHCGHPEATGCQVPTINCEHSVTCPITPPGEGSGGGCGGCDKSRCRRNIVEDQPLPSEVEIVEKTLCVAMKSDYKFKWVLQSCNQHHRFVCEKKQRKDGIWKGYMDNMVIG